MSSGSQCDQLVPDHVEENVQLLGVWRFLPPFGSLQIAYQTGTSEIGTASEQDDTVFTKLSWVF